MAMRMRTVLKDTNIETSADSSALSNRRAQQGHVCVLLKWGEVRTLYTCAGKAERTVQAAFRQHDTRGRRSSRSQGAAIPTMSWRAGKLEAAISALGESDPTVPALKEALRQVRLQAQVRPVEERIEGTKYSSIEPGSESGPRPRITGARDDFCNGGKFSARRRRPVGGVAAGSAGNSSWNPSSHCTRRLCSGDSVKRTICVRSSIPGLGKVRRSVSGRAGRWPPHPPIS